jgi:hypothetical protein
MIIVLKCGTDRLSFSELYYKSLSDVNTYTIDNVRIRYAASNVANYAQGLDLRLNGSLCQEQNHG